MLKKKNFQYNFQKKIIYNLLTISFTTNPTIIGENIPPQILTAPINDIMEPAKFGDKSKLLIINPALIDALIPIVNVINDKANATLPDANFKQYINIAGITMPIVVNIFLDNANDNTPRFSNTLEMLLNTTVINNIKMCGNAEKKAFYA